MSDTNKTRDQLSDGLDSMRRRIAELETGPNEGGQTQTALERFRERLRILFEFASDAYILVDFEGRIVDGNSAAGELTGYTREETIGRSLVQINLVHPDDLPKAAANLAKTASGQPAGPTEYRLTRKDGSERVVETKSFPVKVGSETLVLANARDITERRRTEEALKRAQQEMEARVRERTADLAKANEELLREVAEHRKTEAALRASEETYRLVAENQTDVVWAMDMNLRHTYCSPSVTRLRGVSLEEAMAEAPEDYLAPSSLEIAMQALAEELAVENMGQKDLSRTRNLELEMTRKDGSTVWTDNTIAPLRDQEGRLVGLVGVMRDISARRKAEEELRASEERYRVLAETANEMIVVAQDEVLKYSNPKAVEITGYSREEMARMPFTELIHPDDRRMVMERYLRRLSGEEFTHAYPFRVVDKAGGIKWVEINAVRTTWEGKPATLNFLDDITQRRESEEAVAHHVKRVEALHAVARTVCETLDRGELLNSALEKVVEVTSADIGSIYILDEPEKVLSLKAQRGMTDEFVRNVSAVKLDDKELQTLRQWKELHAPLSQVRSERTLRSVSEALEKEQIRSFAAVPLTAKGNLQGVLSVGSRTGREFTPDDIDLLVAIGQEIGVGIENSMLLERTRELSITDDLTGLYNRRHFYETLDIEMSRTQRYGRPFSLVMVDLDGFKAYNDKFGHATGDRVLKAFAQTLTSALRKTDIAFRYGGDEFTIIQPGTDADRAGKIVERIRSKWLQKLKAEKLDLETPLGFSAGISQFPKDAQTADALVSLADSALYRSKRAGGFRTTLSSDLVRA
jgi:diguanylate cyclase (GGDEF)-like protein/PAS domain S-box-containing protein